jgi:hypothetical protein
MMIRKTNLEIMQASKGAPLLLLNVDVLPPHPHSTAGVNLQANHAIGEFGRRVIVIRNLYAVEFTYDMTAPR